MCKFVLKGFAKKLRNVCKLCKKVKLRKIFMHVIKLYYKNHLKSAGFLQIFLCYSLFARCEERETNRRIENFRDTETDREKKKVKKSEKITN